MVGLARRSYLDSVDHDGEVVPADGLPRKCQNALDEGNADREVASEGEEACQRLRWHGNDQVRYSELVDWLAGGRVQSEHFVMRSKSTRELAWN
jgi:hypothetical protein